MRFALKIRETRTADRQLFTLGINRKSEACIMGINTDKNSFQIKQKARRLGRVKAQGDFIGCITHALCFPITIPAQNGSKWLVVKTHLRSLRSVTFSRSYT